MFLKILQNSQINIFAGAFFLIKLQAGNLKLSEAATGDIFLKRRTGVSEPVVQDLRNRCYWINDKLHRKKPMLESLFNKAVVPRTCNFIKEHSDTVASL